MNCHTTTAANQVDGAPHRGKHETEGGGEADGEERLEGPARKGSY